MSACSPELEDAMVGNYLARAAWFTLRRDTVVSLKATTDGMECMHRISRALIKWALAETTWYPSAHVCNQIITYRTAALAFRARVSRSHITLPNAS